MTALLIGLLALAQTATPVFLGRETGVVASAPVLFAWTQDAPVDYFVLCLDDQPFDACPQFTPTDPMGISFVGPLANVPPGTHTLSVSGCFRDGTLGCSEPPATITFQASAPAPLAHVRAVGGA